MKAILKFCATNKLFEFKNALISKFLIQICDLLAFKHILDLTSKSAGADWTEYILNPFKLFQILVISLFLIAVKMFKTSSKWC